MTNLTRRERTALLLAAAVVLLVGLPGLLLNERRSGGPSPAAARQEQTRLRAELASLRREIADLESRVRSEAPAGRARDLVPRMVRSAQEAAKRAGVRLADVKPTPVEETAGVQRVAVTVSAAAHFPGAARFLYELERLAGRCRVDQFRLISTNPRTDELQIEVRLTACVKSEEADHET